MKLNQEKEFNFFKDNNNNKLLKKSYNKILYFYFGLLSVYTFGLMYSFIHNDKTNEQKISTTTTKQDYLSVSHQDIQELISLNILDVNKNFIVEGLRLNSHQKNTEKKSDYQVIIKPNGSSFSIHKIVFENKELHYFVLSPTFLEYQKLNSTTKEFEPIQTTQNITYYHIIKRAKQKAFINNIQSFKTYR